MSTSDTLSFADSLPPTATVPMAKIRTGNRSSRQSGAIAIMFALLLIPILGICALAIDLAMVYNREAEMHNLAKAVALSAARKLNGTSGGIANAVADAASTASVMKFKNFAENIPWSANALRFGTRPEASGAWMDAASAASAAAQIFYVRVDTSALEDAGMVPTALARVLSEALASITVSSTVIAGRTDIAVAPLAICAMSVTPAAKRVNSGGYNELVEYGFRRGISYDLMNLNPNDTSPLSYVINPLATPGTSGDAADLAIGTVGPYACSGTLGIPALSQGMNIAVSKGFPLASLYRQLNSRFDQYDGDVCTANGAPPDTNIKAYDYTGMVTPLQWMNTMPAGQTAAVSVSASRLETKADIAPPGGTAAQNGPLWAYAKAVSYETYTASPVEPIAGYATIATTAWSNLYGGQVAKSTYPASTPYRGAGVNQLKPVAAHAPGLKNRRVLNVPLLNCSTTPGTSAEVLAVGKFFMTVPATPTALAAEFAGTLQFDRITGYSGLFQ